MISKAIAKKYGKLSNELFFLCICITNNCAVYGLPSITIDLKEQEIATTNTLPENASLELQLQFNKVKESQCQGYTIRAISRSVGITRATIRNYLAMDFLPKKKVSRSTNFDAYQALLLEENNAGMLYKIFMQI